MVFTTLAEQPRYDPMDCGGAGDCGYLCVAAALAFEKGENETSFKDALGTRARTIRNDVYKHLAKHKDEYKEWFVPDSRASEEQEALLGTNFWKVHYDLIDGYVDYPC